MITLKKILIVLTLFIVFSVQLVYAHPLLLSSDPAQSTVVAAGTDRVIIRFSEAVEIDFSYIRVFDSDGNQIDNKDTRYLNGDELVLVVTTPPLGDGIYTVTTQVLSKVDGHLVPYAFVFGAGNVDVPLPEHKTEQVIYFPEAGARFPGLVGQTIVLGGAIAALAMWGSLSRKDLIREDLPELQKTLTGKFFAVIGIGLFLVFASNILMLVVQTIRLQASAADVLRTAFGEVWIVRMAITVVLLAIWFLVENKSSISPKKQMFIVGMSLALISTTSVIGHGAASQQISALVIDYIHNLLAAVWIGGVIFFGFVLLPTFAKLDETKKELATLVAIPRFSSLVLIALGIVIVTGPTLLWLLEDDVLLLSESYYGYLIIGKILIGSAMVALGGYNQVRIQKPAENTIKTGNTKAYKKLKRSLKVEAALGIVLLGIVALLTNTSLPIGQAQEVETSNAADGFATSLFSENARFDVSIDPFINGQNSISISALDLDGNVLDDVESIRVKIANPERNITPIEIPVSGESGIYTGEITFGFPGTWSLEIMAQRNQHVNEVTGASLLIKPRLAHIKADVTEYGLPVEGAAPLYPAYDGDNTIWISDSSKGRLWKFSIPEEQFNSYEFDGKTTVFLKIEGSKIWFTDTPEGKIGYFDTLTETFTIIPLPVKALPISLESDLDGNIWIALVDRHSILKYSPHSGEFTEYNTPTNPSGPVALLRDESGNIWFAESQGGKIAVIDPKLGKIKEFVPDEPLKEPFALFIDEEQNVLIAEHVGLSVVRFNPYLQTFDSFRLTDPESLPFGLTADKYSNIWIAQHTVDKLGIYDPHNDDFIEVDIPTKSSFTQFVTSDKDGNVWFVEQRGNKLGKVEISETPQFVLPPEEYKIRYSELVTPLVSAGIVASSLFFVKSIHDRRRLDSDIK